MVLGGTGSVEAGTGWYLVVLCQYGVALVGTLWYLVSIKWYWVSKELLCLYISKKRDLVGCHHSGTDERTNKQGKMRVRRGLKGLRGLTRGKYPPSFLECLSHQDSENIAHC